MYTEGNIIYFDPFYFKNGTAAKRKYFLVLNNSGAGVILASLPSSVIHLPAAIKINHGCIDIPESCISCYVFEHNVPVTKGGWSFPLHTFLYGNWIDEFSLDILAQTYRVEGVDYEIIGQLTDKELQSVKDCFKNSVTVKRKYKKILSS